jgi:putative FmdB family regulatory protein
MRYDYCCDKCVKVWEVNLRLSELDQPVNCEECGELARRLPPTGTSFKFKCCGSSKDYKHREDQAKRKAGVYNKGAKLD